MRKRIIPLVATLVIIVLSIVSISLYQDKKEAEEDIYRKELLIFQNHVTGTVRAVEAKEEKLLEEKLLQLSTFETFHSRTLEFGVECQILVDTYKEGILHLLNAEPDNYSVVNDELSEIFNTIVSNKETDWNEKEFNSLVAELFPIVENFRDEAETLSEG
ncbi:hypothetical protein GMD78_20550 [Ornithinibacillus sp. L9]|uniref:Uncharacterized protein n=1 Tax=Ornithinibacillus caprae TaxID=2678566 RepID=A0A6N8FM87_9BACI|nr:hypothetical protein [Ornithinibacillus caprae]MUK90750.1 hypothetical protein [Ornithinibacillus caprae]